MFQESSFRFHSKHKPIHEFPNHSIGKLINRRRIATIYIPATNRALVGHGISIPSPRCRSQHLAQKRSESPFDDAVTVLESGRHELNGEEVVDDEAVGSLYL